MIQILIYFVGKIGKFFVYILLIISTLLLFYLNISLYYSPQNSLEHGVAISTDVKCQLNYIKQNLRQGNAGQLAQNKYPEGFVFIHALYGLTWCDFLTSISPDHPYFEEGQEELDWVTQQLKSPAAHQQFPTHISPSKGIFYLGWFNYLIANRLLLEEPGARDTNLLRLYQKQSDQIYQAYKKQAKTYLESYHELVWPADNMVAIASLALADEITDSLNYDHFIQDWLVGVKQKLDMQTGLIPHEVQYDTELVEEGAKGSSQSLMLNFLIDIDSSFAIQQFQQYQQLFLDYRLGLPGIREYPKGMRGDIDIDSGPIIWGIGGAASLVGQRTMARFGMIETSVGLRNSIESFGVAFTLGEQKKYCFGLEPIADAFIAWANVVNIDEEEAKLGNWRWSFQLFSLVLLILIILIRKGIKKSRKLRLQCT